MAVAITLSQSTFGKTNQTKRWFVFDETSDEKVLGYKAKIEKIKKAIAGEEKNLVFGIRPEAIKEDAKGKEYEAEFVELLGDEYYVHFTFGGKRCLAKISADTKVAKGDKIKLGIQEQKMHLFDPISEKAIL